MSPSKYFPCLAENLANIFPMIRLLRFYILIGRNARNNDFVCVISGKCFHVFPEKFSHRCNSEIFARLLHLPFPYDKEFSWREYFNVISRINRLTIFLAILLFFQCYALTCQLKIQNTDIFQKYINVYCGCFHRCVKNIHTYIQI